MKIVQYDLLIARSVCVMEAKDKIRIRKEPCLKKSCIDYRESNDRSQWAEQFDISRSQVGRILKNKRTFVVVFIHLHCT